MATQPVIEAGDITFSEAPAGDETPDVDYPAYDSGDLLIMVLSSDDDYAGNTVTVPTAQPDGETKILNVNQDVINTGVGPSINIIAWVGTATKITGSLAWTISSPGESWKGFTIKVPAGEFDSTTPLSTTSGLNWGKETSLSGTAIPTPAWTASSDDTDGTIICPVASNDDTITAPSGWTILLEDHGEVPSAGIGVRTAAVTSSESIASADFPVASASGLAGGIIVRAPGPTITNVSGDNVLTPTEDPWVISGSGFGTD